MGFKEQLTKLRKKKQINQVDLANMMGVKQYVVSSWETGRSEPNINQILKLSEIFDLPTDYLLDKPTIKVSSEDEFNKIIENINNDINDDFITEIKTICNDLPKKKKDKIIKIIKEVCEY
ncbi:MAG: helix-turn-helix domain-containing protein [Anaeroplasmataceae bacterium]